MYSENMRSHGENLRRKRMMKVGHDELTFSTGKTLYANRGIVGLCLTDNDEDRQNVFYGYDGDISTPLDDCVSPEHRMTPEECVELADAMLKRWAEFRSHYAKWQTS
jgi:hypothetical protein